MWPFGAAPPGLEDGTLRSTALRREVKLPVGRLFSRIGVGGLRAVGAVTGGRETFRGLAVLGAKILPQGRRDATGGTGRGRRVGFSPAIPREGDTAPRSGGAPLHGGVAEEGDGRKPGRSHEPWGSGSRGVRSVPPGHVAWVLAYAPDASLYFGASLPRPPRMRRHASAATRFGRSRADAADSTTESAEK